MDIYIQKQSIVVNDVRENIRNLTGGRMKHYEKLIEEAVNTALEDLEKKAINRGYDGAIGVKISNPMVVNGAVEVIVYGNGYKKLIPKHLSTPPH